MRPAVDVAQGVPHVPPEGLALLQAAEVDGGIACALVLQVADEELSPVHRPPGVGVLFVPLRFEVSFYHLLKETSRAFFSEMPLLILTTFKWAFEQFCCTEEYGSSSNIQLKPFLDFEYGMT